MYVTYDATTRTTRIINFKDLETLNLLYSKFNNQSVTKSWLPVRFLEALTRGNKVVDISDKELIYKLYTWIYEHCRDTTFATYHYLKRYFKRTKQVVKVVDKVPSPSSDRVITKDNNVPPRELGKFHKKVLEQSVKITAAIDIDTSFELCTAPFEIIFIHKQNIMQCQAFDTLEDGTILNASASRYRTADVRGELHWVGPYGISWAGAGAKYAHISPELDFKTIENDVESKSKSNGNVLMVIFRKQDKNGVAYIATDKIKLLSYLCEVGLSDVKITFAMFVPDHNIIKDLVKFHNLDKSPSQFISSIADILKLIKPESVTDNTHHILEFLHDTYEFDSTNSIDIQKMFNDYTEYNRKRLQYIRNASSSVCSFTQELMAINAEIHESECKVLYYKPRENVNARQHLETEHDFIKSLYRCISRNTYLQ